MSIPIEFEIPLVPMTINTYANINWRKRPEYKKLWMSELSVALHRGPAGASHLRILRAWADLNERVHIAINVLHAQMFDPDNLYSAAKVPLDALKGMGCLVDDSGKHIELSVTQEKSKLKLTRFVIRRIEDR